MLVITNSLYISVFYAVNTDATLPNHHPTHYGKSMNWMMMYYEMMHNDEKLIPRDE